MEYNNNNINILLFLLLLLSFLLLQCNNTTRPLFHTLLDAVDTNSLLHLLRLHLNSLHHRQGRDNSSVTIPPIMVEQLTFPFVVWGIITRSPWRTEEKGAGNSCDDDDGGNFVFSSSNNSNKINYCSSSYLARNSDKYDVGTKWSIIRPPDGIRPNQAEAALPMVCRSHPRTRMGNSYATGRAIFNRRRPPWSAENTIRVLIQRGKYQKKVS